MKKIRIFRRLYNEIHGGIKMTTQEINQGLEVKKIDGLKFGNRLGYYMPTGFAFYHKELGFLSFKSDNKRRNNVSIPYLPQGGEKALQSILDSGGLVDYDGIEWIQAI